MVESTHSEDVETNGSPGPGIAARIPKCPSCGYSWQGLPDKGECPECGLEFDEHSRIWSGAAPPRWVLGLTVGGLILIGGGLFYSPSIRQALQSGYAVSELSFVLIWLAFLAVFFFQVRQLYFSKAFAVILPSRVQFRNAGDITIHTIDLVRIESVVVFRAWNAEIIVIIRHDTREDLIAGVFRKMRTAREFKTAIDDIRQTRLCRPVRLE